jgi:hypothetical protein
MSDAKEKNGRQPDEDEVPPTASYSNSVPGPGSRIWRFIVERELNRSEVVVHWTNRSIRSFDFLNVNDYSTVF